MPNPAAARGVRVSTYDKVLKKHGIRRFDGAALKNRLAQRPLDVDPAAVRAAEAHARLLAKRLAVLNDQIAGAKTQLEAFLGRLGNADPEPGAGGEPPPGQSQEQRDVTILRSLPGVGTVVAATLFAEAHDALRRRDYHALRCLCGVAPVTRQSGRRRIVTGAWPPTTGCATPPTTGPASRRSTIRCARPATTPCAGAATVTPARCVPSPKSPAPLRDRTVYDPQAATA